MGVAVMTADELRRVNRERMREWLPVMTSSGAELVLALGLDSRPADAGGLHLAMADAPKKSDVVRFLRECADALERSDVIFPGDQK
jgi:hypothetical protein